MRKQFLFTLFIAVLLSACSSAPLIEEYTPTEIFTNDTERAASTPLPLLPIFTATAPTEGMMGFPYAAELNELLPKENLLLAVHVYGDDVANMSDETCYDAGVYAYDTYIVISCLSDFAYPAPTGTLDAYQSKFLQRWVETFQGFEEPSVNGLLVFAGKGKTAAEFSDKASMRAMLGEFEWAAHQYEHRGGLPSALSVARSVLSNRLGVWLDRSNDLKFEVVEFPDSCLDAPKLGEACEQVVTTGFRIYFVVQGLMYEYHTDVWGYDIRPFGEPQTAPTQGPGG